MKFKNIRNEENQLFGQDYMVELQMVEDADFEDLIMAKDKLAFVLEHHAQKIYQVESGRLAGYWTTKYYENGKRRVKQLKSKQALIQFLYDFYKEGEGYNKTFETVYNEAVDHRRNIGKIQYKTVEDYMVSFNRFMLPLKDKKISSFTDEMLMMWITDILEEQKPKVSVYDHMFGYVDTAFKYAVRKKYIATNPMDSIDRSDYYRLCDRGIKKPEETYFTDEEVELIRNYAKQHLDNPRALLILLNAEMGTRAGELPALRWDDVEDEFIRIHAQQIRNDETTPQTFEVVEYTKNARRKADGQPREFPITPRIRQILNIARQMPGESEYVFHDKNGAMITKDTYERHLMRVCRNYLHLTKTNNHCFRRHVNLILIELGYDTSERAYLLGQTTRTNDQDYSPSRVKNMRRIQDDLTRYHEKKDGLVSSPTFTQQNEAIRFQVG